MEAGHAVRHARIVYKQRHGGDRPRDNRQDLRRSGVPGRKPVLRRRRPAILGRAVRLLDLPFRVNTISEPEEGAIGDVGAKKVAQNQAVLSAIRGGRHE